MDPLLRHSLGDMQRGGTDPCPDAEMLAAFQDGELTGTERQAIEVHVSDCGRCSAILSSSADASPDLEQPSVMTPLAHLRAHDVARNPWRHAYWTVPLATAATVAGLWIASPREAVAPAPKTMTASRADGSEPPVGFRDRSTDTAERSAAAAAPVSEVQPPAEEQAGAGLGAANGNRLPAPQARMTDESSAAPAAPPPTATQQARAAETADRVELRRELASAAADAAAAAVRFGTPDGRVQWRVAGTSIERSTDSGMTWTAEYTASRALTAGVALDAESAWAGGEQGLVLRRTAGGWATVSPPLPQRVTAIRATSPTTASVTVADGRTFQTTDAGASWR